MRRLVLVLLAPAAALFVAGCGGNSGSGANATWTTPIARRTRDILHYRRPG